MNVVKTDQCEGWDHISVNMRFEFILIGIDSVMHCVLTDASVVQVKFTLLLFERRQGYFGRRGDSAPRSLKKTRRAIFWKHRNACDVSPSFSCLLQNHPKRTVKD